MISIFQRIKGRKVVYHPFFKPCILYLTIFLILAPYTAHHADVHYSLEPGYEIIVNNQNPYAKESTLGSGGSHPPLFVIISVLVYAVYHFLGGPPIGSTGPDPPLLNFLVKVPSVIAHILIMFVIYDRLKRLDMSDNHRSLLAYFLMPYLVFISIIFGAYHELTGFFIFMAMLKLYDRSYTFSAIFMGLAFSLHLAMISPFLATIVVLIMVKRGEKFFNVLKYLSTAFGLFIGLGIPFILFGGDNFINRVFRYQLMRSEPNLGNLGANWWSNIVVFQIAGVPIQSPPYIILGHLKTLSYTVMVCLILFLLWKTTFSKIRVGFTGRNFYMHIFKKRWKDDLASINNLFLGLFLILLIGNLVINVQYYSWMLPLLLLFNILSREKMSDLYRIGVLGFLILLTDWTILGYTNSVPIVEVALKWAFTEPYSIIRSSAVAILGTLMSLQCFALLVKVFKRL